MNKSYSQGDTVIIITDCRWKNEIGIIIKYSNKYNGYYHMRIITGKNAGLIIYPTINDIEPFTSNNELLEDLISDEIQSWR